MDSIWVTFLIIFLQNFSKINCQLGVPHLTDLTQKDSAGANYSPTTKDLLVLVRNKNEPKLHPEDSPVHYLVKIPRRNNNPASVNSLAEALENLSSNKSEEDTENITESGLNVNSRRTFENSADFTAEARNYGQNNFQKDTNDNLQRPQQELMNNRINEPHSQVLHNILKDLGLPHDDKSFVSNNYERRDNSNRSKNVGNKYVENSENQHAREHNHDESFVDISASELDYEFKRNPFKSLRQKTHPFVFTTKPVMRNALSSLRYSPGYIPLQDSFVHSHPQVVKPLIQKNPILLQDDSGFTSSVRPQNSDEVATSLLELKTDSLVQEAIPPLNLIPSLYSNLYLNPKSETSNNNSNFLLLKPRPSTLYNPDVINLSKSSLPEYLNLNMVKLNSKPVPLFSNYLVPFKSTPLSLHPNYNLQSYSHTNPSSQRHSTYIKVPTRRTLSTLPMDYEPYSDPFQLSLPIEYGPLPNNLQFSYSNLNNLLLNPLEKTQYVPGSYLDTPYINKKSLKDFLYPNELPLSYLPSDQSFSSSSLYPRTPDMFPRRQNPRQIKSKKQFPVKTTTKKRLNLSDYDLSSESTSTFNKKVEDYNFETKTYGTPHPDLFDHTNVEKSTFNEASKPSSVELESNKTDNVDLEKDNEHEDSSSEENERIEGLKLPAKIFESPVMNNGGSLFARPNFISHSSYELTPNLNHLPYNFGFSNYHRSPLVYPLGYCRHLFCNRPYY